MTRQRRPSPKGREGKCERGKRRCELTSLPHRAGSKRQRPGGWRRVARKPEPRSLCWKWPLGRWGSGPVSDCALLRREPGRPLLVAKPHSAGDLPLRLNAKPAPRTPRGSGEDTEDRQVGQPRTSTCGRGQARAPGPGPRSRLPASQAGRGACGRSENTLKIRTLQCSPENRLGAEITQQSHSMLRGLSRVLPGPQTRQRVSVHVKRDTSHTVSRRSGHPAPDRQLRVACSAAQQRPAPPHAALPGARAPSRWAHCQRGSLGPHREGRAQFSQKCRRQQRLREDRLPLGQPQRVKTK